MIAGCMSSVVRSCTRHQLPVDLLTEVIVYMIINWNDCSSSFVFSMSGPCGFVSCGVLECCVA